MHDPVGLELHDARTTEKHPWCEVVHEMFDRKEIFSSPAISAWGIGAGFRSSRTQLLSF
jgi:hypothetical protein